MKHPLRFQVLALANVPWPEQVRRFRQLEDLGFDVAAMGDHLVDWTGPEKPMFEAWTSLSGLAVETSAIRLTTSVTQIPLRNPALLAHMATSLDHISGGRLEVGIGTGLRMDPGTEMAGLDNWSNTERVERIGEYAEVLKRALSEEVSHFKGKYYTLDGLVMSPLPVQKPRPPITMAAMGPKMLRQAARHADIWNSLSFKPSFEDQLDETRDRVEQFQASCAEIDRDPNEARWSFTLFEPDARHKGGELDCYASEDVFVERVEAAIALGMSEISLYYPLAESQIPMFEHLARNVIPDMKRRHAMA